MPGYALDSRERRSTSRQPEQIKYGLEAVPQILNEVVREGQQALYRTEHPARSHLDRLLS